MGGEDIIARYMKYMELLATADGDSDAAAARAGGAAALLAADCELVNPLNLD